MRKRRNLVPFGLVLVFFSFSFGNAFAQQKLSAKFIKENFDFADSQYRFMIQNTESDKLPQTFNHSTGKIVSYEKTWWCSGFYPGNLLYIYAQTKDSVLLKEAKKVLDVLAPNQFFTENHDLGFMMFCSFGNAYSLMGDTAYKRILLNAATSLSTRYRPNIPAIQSWPKSKYFNCPAIIDNMMNLELLQWASRNGGNLFFDTIAINHANTTIKNHFRNDYSSFHVIDYNEKTGAVLKKKTFQGYSDSSSWSRGQSWGLYGYTMMYRFTKDNRYLEQARHIAKYILDNPTLPKDMIPYWDYKDPGIPKVPRDASAAAVMASALLELSQYSKGAERKQYVNSAVIVLKSLASPAYRSRYKENGGFLLMHSTGALPFKSEVDVPLIYADYYFLEALTRYKNWFLKSSLNF